MKIKESVVRKGRKGKIKVSVFRDEKGRFLSKARVEEIREAARVEKEQRIKTAFEKSKNVLADAPGQIFERPTKQGMRFVDERGRFVSKNFWPEEYLPAPSMVVPYWETASALKQSPEQFVEITLKNQAGQIVYKEKLQRNEALRYVQELIRKQNSEKGGDGHYYMSHFYVDLKNEKVLKLELIDYDKETFADKFGDTFI